ncbi:hypothetical protein OPT61_g4516 [Boeremia exigua]|uniref:Uncharacterized protein n=1 Tax=Boeremia exigua TaxID=749465 RepID=A0ACC2IDW5_9PLEO|nr:hypothetical protein OPT61_g4516 [Boeremia exigua]
MSSRTDRGAALVDWRRTWHSRSYMWAGPEKLRSESEWNLYPLQHPSGDTSSREAVMTINHWIDTCKDEHEECKCSQEPQSMPERVLELTADCIRLQENLTYVHAYACLSHCWGEAGPAMKLTSANVGLMKAGVPIIRLPKTFHDTVELCLKIGLRYLWIDALCIIQDDPVDWQRAAATMGDIYAGATITLAASRSCSSDQGLFSRMNPSYETIALKEPGLYVRAILPSFPRDVSTNQYLGDYWPLLDRGWVYQERKLSARVVHFGQDQLYWECGARMLSEDGSEDIRHIKMLDLKSNLADPIDAWRSTVEHYSKLKLSYEDDRLPAISAVVKQMQSIRQDDIYAAGMWRDSLLEDLSWEPIFPPGERRGSRPTWSWISVSSGVFWCPNTVLKTTTLVRTDFQVTGPSHFGQTTGASITLRGPAASFILRDGNASLSSHRLRCPKLPEEYADVQKHAYCNPDFVWNTAELEPRDNDHLSFLLLWHTHGHGDPVDGVMGLILRHAGSEQYQRVGTIHFERHNVYVFYQSHDENRVVGELVDRYVASLPIKEFTIV